MSTRSPAVHALPLPAKRWAFLRVTALLFAAAVVLSACQAHGYRSSTYTGYHNPYGVSSFGYRSGGYGFHRGGFSRFGGRHGFNRH